MGTIQDFESFRRRLNHIISERGDRTMKRFFALDQRAYEPGRIDKKTKEMLGLAASMVLRCDDCITYHLLQCHRLGVSEEELFEVFSVALVVGGSIVIPHLRRAVDTLVQLQEEMDTDA